VSFQLLVEGPDDRHVIRNLLRHRGYTFDEGRIRDLEGIHTLLQGLPVYLKMTEVPLGVVVDADVDLNARWQSVRDRFRAAGYSDVPTAPDANGTISRQDGRPVVGVWIMPDNSLPGSLEDFVHKLVPGGDRLWPIARETVDSIPAADRRFPVQLKGKVQIHTWLAWQEQPGSPMGAAITKKYLDGDSTHADAFVNWFRRLRGEASESTVDTKPPVS
jgi:hypothetical protein